MFIDVSHVLKDKMVGFKLQNEDGSLLQYSIQVKPFLTHDQTRLKFKEKCSFEVTELSFQTSIGTYLDSPYHRYPTGRDISRITIDELVLPGVVIDLRGRKPFESVGLEGLSSKVDIKGKAVLLNFGWDAYWGKDKYESYPYISEDLIDFFVTSEVSLVGVDTINIDNSADLTRPAHTFFLKEDIFIVENLANLDKLHGLNFRFFAVPLKVEKAASMPIRAFAEIL